MEDQLFNDKNYAGLRLKLGKGRVQTVDTTSNDKEMAPNPQYWGQIDSHAYVLHLEQQENER